MPLKKNNALQTREKFQASDILSFFVPVANVNCFSCCSRKKEKNGIKLFDQKFIESKRLKVSRKNCFDVKKEKMNEQELSLMPKIGIFVKK